MTTYFERTTYNYEPTYLKDYAYPADLEKVSYSGGYETLKFTDMYDMYGEEWLDKVKKNLKCRLNFNYKTVDSKWINQLRSTYYMSDYGTKEEQNERNGKQTGWIKTYVKAAKKNKVIIKADKIVVEPSTMYKCGGDFYVRCYVRFKISADVLYGPNTDKQDELIYSNMDITYLENIKKNQWYEGYYDIGVGGTAFGDNGYDFSVVWDYIADIATK